MRFATKAIRVGQDPDATHRAVVAPIWQTSTFAWNSLDEIPPIDYTRCTNPGRISLEQALASLENAKHCTVFGSGMAAIAAAFSLLENGDDLLMATDIYGGTYRLADVYLRKQGVTYSSFDASDLSSIAAAVKPNSKLLIFESPTNPNLRISDVAAIAAEARRLGLISIFDNTFASPALQNPLDLGVDIVVHSTTKYISGHSDVIGGALLTNDCDIAHAIYEWSKAYGPVPSPFDCWLSLRGLKTMGIRVREHCRNAQAVAEYLVDQPGVTKVHYPGLSTHPDHELAKRQMKGFGGMVSVEFESAAMARAVAERTKVFLLAESLGGVESLVAYPPLMSHATMTEEQRLERGIPPTMLRLSVGIEDADDLCEDLGLAIASAREALLSPV
ncbi:MAG: PLP-dependent transferase [Armatimonadetes bacterium]|nr:PLP-dependent transferase [Armatimonadota bacterium]